MAKEKEEDQEILRRTIIKEGIFFFCVHVILSGLSSGLSPLSSPGQSGCPIAFASNLYPLARSTFSALCMLGNPEVCVLESGFRIPMGINLCMRSSIGKGDPTVCSGLF